MNNEQTDNNFQISDIINFLKLKKYLIFILFLIFLFLSIFYLFTSSVHRNYSELFISIVLVQDEKALNLTNKKYIINYDNLKEALNRTDLESDSIDISFLKQFDFINADNSSLMNDNNYADLINKNFNQKIKFDEGENLDLDIKDFESPVKMLIIDKKNLPYNDVTIARIASNLIQVVNERIEVDSGHRGVILKKLSLPNIDITTSYDHIAFQTLDLHLNTLQNYSKTLLENYSLFASDVNLDQLISSIKIASGIYRDLLTSNPSQYEINKKRSRIEIQAITDKILILENLLEYLSEGKRINNDIASINVETDNVQEIDSIDESSSFTLRSDIFDRLLSMSNQVAGTEMRDQFLNNIYELELEKIKINQSLQLVELSAEKSSPDYSSDSEKNFLRVITDITKEINEYINAIESLSSYSENLKIIKNINSQKHDLKTQFLIPLILILQASILLSFAIVFIMGVFVSFKNK
tara:strand:- start:473 stop:1879 length:1407 start_codon:yes stop_codon:yes gene_type:complete